MRTALLLLAFAALPAFAAQVVWKWVDERGVTHFSDRPVPGATRVEIAGAGSSQSSTRQEFVAPDPEQRLPPPGVAYTSFEIWKPANGDSFINNGGQVTVNVRLEPGLQPGHSLHIYLDGRLLEGFPENAMSYDLKEVPRGAHRVLAVINNQAGRRVQETTPVSFTVRQESIAKPPVGPALRPPPKKN